MSAVSWDDRNCEQDAVPVKAVTPFLRRTWSAPDGSLFTTQLDTPVVRRCTSSVAAQLSLSDLARTNES